jgi:hypothetical protein
MGQYSMETLVRLEPGLHIGLALDLVVFFTRNA